MTAEITRLANPMSAHRYPATDMNFAILQSTFFWMTVGVTTTRLMVETYAQTLRLYGWEVKE